MILSATSTEAAAAHAAAPAEAEDAPAYADLDEAELIAAARAHAKRVCDGLDRQLRGDPAFAYDAARAEKAVGFFPKFLRHSVGPLAGRPFELEPWQAAVVRTVFGWRWAASGLRVVRTVYLFVARKNGKSTFCAGLALLMLLADGEAGAEVYSAAADRDQAGIVFREATRMASASEFLSKHTTPFKTALVCERLSASYKVLSADAETKHGLNPSAIIFDELHTQPNRDLYDVLHTAIGARRQPLELLVTTAGYDRHSICWEVHSYALQVLHGAIQDPTLLPVIFAAEEGDDWRDPLTWCKANPSLGSAVRLDYLAGEARRAVRVPGYQNTFRRLHLNEWTEQDSRWLDGADWDACSGEMPWQRIPEAMARRPCYLGLDLSTTTDLSAIAIVWPPEEEGEPWHAAWRFYMPEATLRRRADRDRVPFPLWRDQGALVATPGNQIDYARIEADILAIVEGFDVREVAFDPWNAYQLVQRLQDQGLSCVAVRQGLASLSAPAKELERLVMARGLAHGGHPVAAWMARNVAVKVDDNGNIKPDKAASGDRIDGIVALVVALARAIAAGGEATLTADELFGGVI